MVDFSISVAVGIARHESEHNLDPGGYRGKHKFVNVIIDNEEEIVLRPGRVCPARMGTGT